MPTPIFIDMYKAAAVRDCSLTGTIRNLKDSFPDASYTSLVPLAESLYQARVDFMDAIDRTEEGRRATQRRLVMSCPHCGDKYCSNAELVQFVVIPPSGK
jgi:hypothetical protein